MATMVAYASRMGARPIPTRCGPAGTGWTGRRTCSPGCVRDRDVLPAAQSIDAVRRFRMADEEGTLATVYELVSQPYDDTVRAAMRRFIADHPAAGTAR